MCKLAPLTGDIQQDSDLSQIEQEQEGIPPSRFDSPLNIGSQEGIPPFDTDDHTSTSSTPLVKDSASVKDEPLDVTDLLLVPDDISMVDMFKGYYTIHMYAEKKQLNRPK